MEFNLDSISELRLRNDTEACQGTELNWTGGNENMKRDTGPVVRCPYRRLGRHGQGLDFESRFWTENKNFPTDFKFDF